MSASLSPAPWRKYTGALRPQFPTLIFEIHDALGREVVKWAGFDGLDLPRKTVGDNVRLLAAAPELLTALKVALPYIDEFSGAGNVHAKVALMVIRSALRKALGNRWRDYL